MSEELPDRTLAPETIERMVQAVRPGWTVSEASLATEGYTSVYHLAIETDGGPGECVLKASPDGDRHGIDTEARLLSIVGERTGFPVPDVLGAVDVHGDLRAPFFLMNSLPGETVHRRDIGSLSDEALKRVARETGQYLAELHTIDAVDEFGAIDCDRTEPLTGGRPTGGIEQLTVADACESWPTLIREQIDEVLSYHETTRFGDLTSEIRTALLDGVDELSGPFAPVLGRIDHGLHNVRIDPETGEIKAMLDWGFTLAVPSAYDFICVEHVLSASDWSMVPDVPNRREVVREAMLAGYRSERPAPNGLGDHRALYELLTYARSMNHLDAGISSVAREDPTDVAADGFRERIRVLLDDS